MIDKEKWMRFALKQAVRAYDHDEVPIGCVVVKDDKVIGRGYNQVEGLNDCTAHSEIIAITSASNSIGDWRLTDCSIFVTKEPCLMCFGAIINSRINSLYFGLSDDEYGFRNIIKENKLLYNKKLTFIEPNIMEIDCKSIIQQFFIEKRKNNHNNSNK